MYTVSCTVCSEASRKCIPQNEKNIQQNLPKQRIPYNLHTRNSISKKNIYQNDKGTIRLACTGGQAKMSMPGALCFKKINYPFNVIQLLFSLSFSKGRSSCPVGYRVKQYFKQERSTFQYSFLIRCILKHQHQNFKNNMKLDGQ